jgi:hypothetical protein
VGAKGAVAGIISERDIIRCLSAHGPDCLSHPVSEREHDPQRDQLPGG